MIEEEEEVEEEEEKKKKKKKEEKKKEKHGWESDLFSLSHAGGRREGAQTVRSRLVRVSARGSSCTAPRIDLAPSTPILQYPK